MNGDTNIVIDNNFLEIKNTVVSRQENNNLNVINKPYYYYLVFTAGMGTVLSIPSYLLANNAERDIIPQLLFEKSTEINKNISESIIFFDFYKQILNDFTIENKEKIFLFIQENSEIINPLYESKFYTKEYFDTFKLSLSLHEDSYSGESHLNIIILNNLSTEDAIKKEDLLFRNWFIRYYKKFNGKLNIRVEYSDEL